MRIMPIDKVIDAMKAAMAEGREDVGAVLAEVDREHGKDVEGEITVMPPAIYDTPSDVDGAVDD